MKRIIVSIFLTISLLSICTAGCSQSYTQQDLDIAYDQGWLDGFQDATEALEPKPESSITPSPTPTPKPTPITTKSIRLTGSGSKTTRPFKIDSREWTVSWSYKADEPEWAVFSFFIYPRGETEQFVTAILFPKQTSGSTYSYAGSGEYYLTVEAGNIKSWEIIIKPA